MARDDDRQQQMPSRRYGSGGMSRSPYSGRGYESYPSRYGESDWWSASPFQMMRRMQEEMERVFGSFFGQPQGGGSAQQAMTGWSPSIDVYEAGNELVIKADIPGVEPEDLEVYCTDDAIVLRGEMRREEERQEEGGYRSERRYGRFERQIPLPPGARPEDVKANSRNGVLEIRVPRSEEAMPRARRIPIGSQASARSGQSGALAGSKGGEAGMGSQPTTGPSTGMQPGQTEQKKQQ